MINISNNWRAVLGALVSAVLMAVLGYILSVGDVWKLDLHTIVNMGVMAGIVSLLKFGGTTQSSNFAGIVPVPPAKTPV